MKREIPVFQYDDAWQILARGDRLKGLVIDAGSEEVMLRIEASMSKLKVMGDDDRRFFWIWAQVNKREREWLQVLTAHYNDFHYLILGDNRSEMAVLQNAESIYSNEEKYREDVKEPLLALETHVKVDEIDSILKILRQEDMVGFRPHPDKYMNRDGVTNQVWLPHIGDVTREVYWKIIKSTKWHKQHKPWPND